MNPLSLGMFNIKLGPNQILSGPSRVFPGRLSVCRSFGDAESKSERHGGNPKVIIAEPEVQTMKLTEDQDCIILGCKCVFLYLGDGIFDQISNEEIGEAIWMTMDKLGSQSNIHTQAGLAVDMIMKTALARRSLDNITCVFIGLENWEKTITKKLEQFTNTKKDKDKESPKHKDHKEKETDRLNKRSLNVNTSNELYALSKSHIDSKLKSHYSGFRSASSGKKLKEI